MLLPYFGKTGKTVL